MEINDTRVGDVLLSWNNILAVVIEKKDNDKILLAYLSDDGFKTGWISKLRAYYFRENFSLVVKAND